MGYKRDRILHGREACAVGGDKVFQGRLIKYLREATIIIYLDADAFTVDYKRARRQNT